MLPFQDFFRRKSPEKLVKLVGEQFEVLKSSASEKDKEKVSPSSTHPPPPAPLASEPSIRRCACCANGVACELG